MKKIIYVDMDNVLVDFESGIRRVPEGTRSEYEGRLDEIPGIFGLMDAMPGAIESYKELAEGFDAYILSTSPWRNPSAWSDKLLWVKKFSEAVAHKRLIISHHKNLLNGQFLIDDRPNNGADQFSGELIRFGSEQFPDWPSIMAYLRGKEI